MQAYEGPSLKVCSAPVLELSSRGHAAFRVTLSHPLTMLCHTPVPKKTWHRIGCSWVDLGREGRREERGGPFEASRAC